MTAHAQHPPPEERSEFLVDGCARCEEYVTELGIPFTAPRFLMFWRKMVDVEFEDAGGWHSELDQRLGLQLYKIALVFQRAFNMDPHVPLAAFLPTVLISMPRDELPDVEAAFERLREVALVRALLRRHLAREKAGRAGNTIRDPSWYLPDGRAVALLERLEGFEERLTRREGTGGGGDREVDGAGVRMLLDGLGVPDIRTLELLVRCGEQVANVPHSPAAQALRALQVLDAHTGNKLRSTASMNVLYTEALDCLGAALGLKCTGEHEGGRFYDHSGDTCPIHEWLDERDADADEVVIVH